MLGNILVEALAPLMGSCAVCGDTRMLGWHDREIGWICNDCVWPTYLADINLNSILGITRPKEQHNAANI